MSDALRAAIRQRGRVEGELVLVDTFLNHRVDPVLLRDVAGWLSDHLGAADAVVTSEASGIAPALIVAELRGVPMVFAKKRNAPRDGTLSRQVVSPTKGDRPWLEFAPHTLDGIGSAVVIDDFLAGGRTARALGEMLIESGIDVVGFGFAVERAWAGGRDRLEEAGFGVVSAAVVKAVEDGRPVVG